LVWSIYKYLLKSTNYGHNHSPNYINNKSLKC
jgi:hypothetical protein